MANLRLVTEKEGSTGREQRAHSRLPWAISNFSILEEGTTVKDFSLGGISFSSRYAPTPHQVIELSIGSSPQDSSVNKLKCEIIWTKKGKGVAEYVVGAKFVNATPSANSLIKYIYNLLAEQLLQPKLTFEPVNLISEGNIDKSVIETIQNTSLPPFFQKVVQESFKFSGRQEYIWKWCYKAMRDTTLPCVDQSYSQLLDNTKLVNFMLTFLLDDLADERKEPLLLAECFKMVLAGQKLDLKKLPTESQFHAEFLQSLWDIIQSNLRQFPRHDQLKEIVQYDLEQSIYSLKYAHLSNTMSDVINEQEAIIFEGNNINIIVNAMMDISCSPQFRFEEVGKLREMLWHGQMMCKISNWVSTWEREVKVGDWTSGVIAGAVSLGVISRSELADANKALIISKINESCVQERLMSRWEWHRSSFIQRLAHVQSVDMTEYLRALEKFFQTEMAIKVLH